MPGMTKKLQKLIHHSENFITIAQEDNQIAAAMGTYGYDEERWAQGQSLLDAAKEKIQENSSAYARQAGAVEEYNQALEKAWEQAQSLAKLCATIMEGQNEKLRLLGLDSKEVWPKENKKIEVFLPWARNLYGIAQNNPDIAAITGDYGYPNERLTTELADIEILADKDAVKETAKGQAQQSTEDRDSAIEALETWIKKAETVAQLALKDKKQLLEALGVQV